MSRIVYVNGRYLPFAEGLVHVEDRGYQFADGVYEVIAAHRGCLVDEEPHLDRLARSLAELRMDWPMSRQVIKAVFREVLRRNKIVDRGALYLQISRGVARRNHAFPTGVRPTLVVMARRLGAFDRNAALKGVTVITVPDIRWRRCDIKSVSLLPNVLVRQQAIEAGAFEAWMVDDAGLITEGTSSNAWIVTEVGEVVTRPPNNAILNGITRRTVRALAEKEGLTFVERPFSVAEAKSATEAFLTSTTSLVKPVILIDDTIIGNGVPGRLTERLADAYARYMNGPEAA